MSADPLSKLAAKYGTDKFGYHHYTPVYERLLRSCRERPIRVLEIGVGGYGDADRGGQSLAMWRDYFPQASIVGIDIQPKNFDLGPRVKILRGSQVDPDFLEKLTREHGPFDIIIDDGSHRNEHVIESFELLYPTLVSGGTYLIEDVQTAFFPSRGGSVELTQPNSVGFFRNLFENPACDARFTIERTLRFHNIVAICKPHSDESKGTRTGHKFADPVCANLHENWRQVFDDLSDMQALMFDEDQTAAIMTELQKLYVDIDHREIAVHFPEYATDPLAPTVYGLERGVEGTFIIKGKNDYPSNFQFDFDHPEVQAVRKEIERQLEEDPSEGGLVSYASMVSSNRGRPAARAYIARLTDMESTSGTYFHMAIALANQDGDLGKALSVCERAVSVYPRNPDLLMALANCHLRMNSNAECLNLVDRAIAVNPRQPKFLFAGARVLLALDDVTKAIELGERALALSPVPKRQQIQLFLAKAHAKNGSPRLALDILEPILETFGNHQGAALRQASGLYRLIGNREKALETAQRACELAPSSTERVAWLASVRRWLGVAPEAVAGL